MRKNSKRSPHYFAHESVVVNDGARIGKGTRIWHFSHVMADAEIGPDCNLGQNIFVGRGVKIGRSVKLQNNVSVYEGVTLEDYVFCGPSVVFTNVRNPRAEFPRDKSEFLPTLVRQGATLGANATVVCGVTIGSFAFVAAGAVVNRDVPDYAVVAGVPARPMGWMCRCGETLKFRAAVAKCRSCSRSYVKQRGRVSRVGKRRNQTPARSGTSNA